MTYSLTADPWWWVKSVNCLVRKASSQKLAALTVPWVPAGVSWRWPAQNRTPIVLPL